MTKELMEAGPAVEKAVRIEAQMCGAGRMFFPLAKDRAHLLTAFEIEIYNCMLLWMCRCREVVCSR